MNPFSAIPSFYNFPLLISLSTIDISRFNDGLTLFFHFNVARVLCIQYTAYFEFLSFPTVVVYSRSELLPVSHVIE